MGRLTIAEFDWCHFCKNDDWYVSCVWKCDSCIEKNGGIPTEFEEKTSVTAYRKRMSEVENG